MSVKLGGNSSGAKVVLITGASSGIGEATAKLLLERGWLVYAGARRLARMEGLKERGARLLELDVTDDASMTKAVSQVIAEAGKVDALVNNAGYGSYGALEDVPMEEARRQVEVNLFGLARMTQLVLPSMRERGKGTIVNVSSIGGKIYEPLGGWYHATKFAVEGLSDCLRMEVEPLGINVVVVEPGGTLTEWAAGASELMLRMSGDTAYREQAQRHAALFAYADTPRVSDPPIIVARVIQKALDARRPRTRYASGRSAQVMLLLRRLLPDRGMDAFMRFIARQAANATPSR